MAKREFKIWLVFYPQKPDGYKVMCPEIPNCTAEGGTIEEACDRALKLIEDAFGSEAQDGLKAELIRARHGDEGKLYTELMVVV